ncbi:hypothetical protein CC85DRAFT_69991 [Cutaneotrichosporon oleaginosum]|uniref:TNFR-Cys domain-containing protein n=1 Tax=Cutaneotrichosporon oleaginosum TaxID=879819 RepID=A0A0J1B5N9_9TREE|nr:uncharacterized protein CC85DRAFT_69991 [Cutaneotrichosporon oleaginosum]KLT43009.1 hypothetical protein CC85DRAFT_69991 [Cutaneotrichosporon oleaginosum]
MLRLYPIDLLVLATPAFGGLIPRATENSLVARQNLTCEPGETVCPNTHYCVNLNIDAAHCGACGRDCGTHWAYCTGGECICRNTMGRRMCWDDPPCRDFDFDVNNCGACDVKCASNEICEDYKCSTCPENMQICNIGSLYHPVAGCVDQSTDPSNCGGCRYRVRTERERS